MLFLHCFVHCQTFHLSIFVGLSQTKYTFLHIYVLFVFYFILMYNMFCFDIQIAKLKNSLLDLDFGLIARLAAAGPNSCAVWGSRPWPCMFSIYSGIYMSPGLQAHEWAPVCWFCFDVTSSVRKGHTR